MAARPRLYQLRKRSRRHEGATPSIYLAFSIGPEMLAMDVWELNAHNDQVALEKATPLFNEGLKRIEVWCGSRKVGDISPNDDDALP